MLMTPPNLGGLRVSLLFWFMSYPVLTATVAPPVKERGKVERALERAMLVVRIAKGPAEAFTPLKAVLESISGVYDEYQVCFGNPV